MRIGILYNLSDYAKTNTDIEKTADAETPLTVRAVKSVFEKRHTVIPIAFSPDAYSYLAEGNIDILFNMCEGFRNDNLGEAYAAALLEQVKIPFTGSNFFTLALCMDKAKTKEILRYHQLPTPDFRVIGSAAELDNDINVPLPVILKPLHEDASIGIYQYSVVDDDKALRENTAEMLATFRQPVLIEHYIDGREMNVSIIGNGDDCSVLPVSEIVFNLPPSYHKIVCYEAKWVKDSLPYNNTPAVCPASISTGLEKDLKETAKRAFAVTGCRDYARIDFRVARHGGSEIVNIIEVNPNPGKYVDSGFVRSAMVSGLSYELLCYKLVETAMKRAGMDTAALYSEQKSAGNGYGLRSLRNGRITETDRLYARRIQETDLPVILTWFNDREISRFMENPNYIYTERELYEMFLITEVHDLDIVFISRETDQPVGYGSLYDVDYTIRSGEISLLIGSKDFRGKGYGTEIVKALVSICFDRYNLESIFCSAVSENKASLGMIMKNGFRQIGTRRKSHFVDGKYYDEILFDLIREDGAY